MARLSFVKAREAMGWDKQIDLYKSPQFCPEPSRTYVVGQPVRVGNLKDAVVHEILRDGKYLVLDYTNVDTNYGNPIETPHVKGVWAWHEIQPIEAEAPAFNFPSLDLDHRATDLDAFLHQLMHAGVDLDPDYQRGLVWDDADREKLITSVLEHRNIGTFVLRVKPFEALAETRYEVIDGKQRLTALMDFFLGYRNYKGIPFHRLAPMDRYKFRSCRIQYAELSVSSEEAMRVFLRLNETGKPMDQRHLEKVRDALIAKGANV